MIVITIITLQLGKRYYNLVNSKVVKCMLNEDGVHYYEVYLISKADMFDIIEQERIKSSVVSRPACATVFEDAIAVWPTPDKAYNLVVEHHIQEPKKP